VLGGRRRRAWRRLPSERERQRCRRQAAHGVGVGACSIVFLDPEVLREPVSVALESQRCARHCAGDALRRRSKWTRGEVQERIDAAERKKRQQASAQNAKLLERVKAAADADRERRRGRGGGGG
jgi:hypothetical protein